MPLTDESARSGLRKAQALQRELLAVAGWPDCRVACQENLRKGREMASYYAMLIKDPERRHQGTGSDEISLKRNLRGARAEVGCRKRLLGEVNQVQEAYRRVGSPG